MKLTSAQHRHLLWFANHGGMGYLKGARICCGENPDNRTNTSASLPFLALVAAGAIEGVGGRLRITEFGLRLLRP
jgi:hypothetical protein